MLTSVDFMTTVTPTILDLKASMDMGPGTFKLMLWYDNEWSYSAQCLRVMAHMYKTNAAAKRAMTGRVSPKILSPASSYINLATYKQPRACDLKPELSLREVNVGGKNVVARFDFNVPVDNGTVVDDFRVRAALPSINHMLAQNPNRIVLVCHFGRPKGVDKKNSVEFLAPIIKSLLGKEVTFIPDGVSSKTVDFLKSREAADEGAGYVYLLENIRFHEGETKYAAGSGLSTLYKQLGNTHVADCFGCVHRKHMSIVESVDGYGFLIEEEVKAIGDLLRTNGKRILGIMGGAKIADKQPMIDCLCKMPNTKIFVGGGLTRGWKEKFPQTPLNVILSRDAYGATDLKAPASYLPDILNNGGGGFDVGPQGMRDLIAEIDQADVIFWNGCLGVIEDPRYRVGSAMIVDYLLAQTGKKVIIGGGETASLFVGKDEPHVYLSTGGGALLAHIQSCVMDKETLPGLAVFEN